MKLLAGCSKGIFLIAADQTTLRLESRPVRDLIQMEGRLLAGTGAGLYGSDDAGLTWNLLGLEDREVWQTRAASNGILYTTTRPAGLFRSVDGGDSWQEVESFAAHPEAQSWCVPIDPPLPGQARTLVIDPQNPDCLWVGVEVGGVMRSTDGGESWALNLPGDNPDLHNLCLHPANSDVLFASTGYGRLNGVAEMIEGNAGVFRSDDRGCSWTYAWHGITPRYSRPMCIDPRTPYGLTVASAPEAFSSHKHPEGAGAMLYRSDDGGRHWRSLCDPDHSPSKANIHGLVPDPQNAGGVLIGTDTGEAWRVSNDAEWELLARGLPPVLALAAVA